MDLHYHITSTTRILNVDDTNLQKFTTFQTDRNMKCKQKHIESYILRGCLEPTWRWSLVRQSRSWDSLTTEHKKNSYEECKRTIFQTMLGRIKWRNKLTNPLEWSRPMTTAVDGVYFLWRWFFLGFFPAATGVKSNKNPSC